MECRHCKSSFEVTNEDRKFFDNISPIFNGKKCQIPDPTFCPDCRQQRRMSMCNERNLYPGECGLCKKRTLTEQSPSRKQPIYCRECWHSDKWDPTAYGRDFDFNRPFFEQMQELRKAVPTSALNTQGTNINSDYIHYAGSCKNCYLIMHADYCEDCYYGYGFKHTLFCVDGFYNLGCELCYDCVDVHKSYGLIGCQDCINCSSSAFLRDCIGCKHCFLCVGLKNKEFCFKNEQLTKEEYEKQMSKIDLGSYKQCQQYKLERKDIEKDHTFKEFQGHNLQNCSGNYLNNCKDVNCSFDCEDVDTGKYLYQVVTGAKNIYDIYQYGLNLQQSYECTISGADSYHLLFCDNCHESSADLIYCWYMESSKNCFGCASMHRKNYCILNKQYTKEEYNKLAPQIIEHMQSNGEWGEFFPSDISLFGYNKTSAQLYYPLKKEEAIKQGSSWDDYELPPPKVDKTIPANRLPDNIKNTPDDILSWAIECEITEKPFKITELELKFYRKQNIPIPRRHPDQRHIDRFNQRNIRKFFDRKCDKCSFAIKTTYVPDHPEKVLCGKCYLETVY